MAPDNKNHIITTLIREELSKVLQELSKPEAPEGAPFGQYLWADPNFIIRKDGAREPDTNEEKSFFNAYVDHVDNIENIDPDIEFENYANIEKFVTSKNGLRYMRKNGLYSKYIDPPNKTVYRTIVVNIYIASMILGISVKKIKERSNKAGHISKDGTVHPEKSQIQSWTVDLNVAKDFFNVRPKMVGILFAANPKDSNNEFYLNPENIINSFDVNKISHLFSEEKETISYGTVHFKEATFLYNNTDKYMTKMQLSKEMKL